MVVKDIYFFDEFDLKVSEIFKFIVYVIINISLDRI